MSEYKRNPRGARRARKSMGRKAIVVLSLMMVLVLAAVGGTIAWLTSTPDPVTNTFTTAGIGITLTETLQSDGNDRETNPWSAQLVPDKTYRKNPVVAVDTTVTNVPIYLFVKFEEINSPNSYMEYNSTLTEANGWKLVTGETNVWYRMWDPAEIEKATADNPYPSSWNLLAGYADDKTEEIHIKETLGATNGLTAAQFPQLKYTAYAIQVSGFEEDVEGAWDKVNVIASSSTTPADPSAE